MSPSRDRIVRRAGALGLRMVAGFVAISGAARAGDVAELLKIARGADLHEAERAREDLEHIGPEAAAEVFGLWAGLPEFGLLTAAERRLLLGALRAWPADRAVEVLVDALPDEPTLDQRLVVLRLLAEVGGHTTVAAVESVCVGIPAEQEVLSQLSEVVEAALVSALRRDPRTFDDLRSRIERDVLPTRLGQQMARALGSVGLGRGLGVLERMLGQSLQLDLAVIDAIGKLSPFDEPRAVFEAARTLRPFLPSIQPEVRRQAALALGDLQDGESVPELLGLLEDSDRRVRRGASLALARISGLDGSEDPVVWKRWYEEELDWLESELDPLVGELAADEPARVVTALRILSMHPMHRAVVSPEIRPLLGHEETLIAVAACSALAKLGDAASFQALLDVLEDERDVVREAGLHALATLTGAKPGTDPEAWRAWLGTGRT